MQKFRNLPRLSRELLPKLLENFFQGLTPYFFLLLFSQLILEAQEFYNLASCLCFAIVFFFLVLSSNPLFSIPVRYFVSLRFRDFPACWICACMLTMMKATQVALKLSQQ